MGGPLSEERVVVVVSGKAVGVGVPAGLLEIVLQLLGAAQHVGPSMHPRTLGAVLRQLPRDSGVLTEHLDLLGRRGGGKA